MSSVTAPAATGWLRRAWWDLGIVSFGWVPFYGWIAAGPLGGDTTGPGWRDAFVLALGVALALNFLHRHYVFLMVYGDQAALRERKRAYLLVPPVALAVVASAFLLGEGKAGAIVLGVLGVWNVWHVIQQRYGILRIYAGRSGGGLETRAHARRDMALLWSSVFLTACVLVQLRRGTFGGHREAQKALALLRPITETFAGWVLLGAAAMGFLWVSTGWLRAELSATPRVSRAPRWWFLTSTFALLLVFVVNGPVVGYLCFGVAHAVEYVGFVHHFGERKYAPETGKRGVAAYLLRDVAKSPLLIVPLLLTFWLLREHRYATAYVVYYSTTSALHFLFDGWIWKVRKPDVARPLGMSG